jgi:hypothetical protein
MRSLDLQGLGRALEWRGLGDEQGGGADKDERARDSVIHREAGAKSWRDFVKRVSNFG